MVAEYPDWNEGIQIQPGQRNRLELDEDYSLLLISDVSRRSRWRSILFGSGFAFLSFLILIGIFVLNVGFGIYTLLGLILLMGWVLGTFLAYRAARQEEVLQVITTAVESEVPIASALMVYVMDRPKGLGRDIWLTFLLPIYHWVWHRWNSFDCRVENLAKALASGVPLYQALRDVPGVASRETVLAAVVGESTGQMVHCLRHANRRRLTTLWGTIYPRIFYPVVVFAFVSLLLLFMTIFILPKFQKIYKDFGLELPALTQWLTHYRDQLLPLIWGTLGLMGLSLAICLLSETVCWYFPLIRWPYRRIMQSRILHTLGVILRAGKTLPTAFEMLARSGYFSRVLVTKLQDTLLALQQGQPLGSSLAANGLVPSSMSPLLVAAERNRHLPTALIELGDHLGNRSLEMVRRLVFFLSPLSILCISVIVALVVVGMFLPLIKLMEALSR